MLQIGNLYNTKNYGTVEVLKTSGERKYEVRFCKTGTIRVFREDAIKSGCIRDPLAKTKCGVGCTGDIKTTGKYRKYYNVWQSMINRCYNTKDKRHQANENVTVCARWLIFSNFYTDCASIDGWDENLFMGGCLQLDKDKKQRRLKTKIYSPETCTWLKPEENAIMQDLQMKPFAAISPYGEMFEADNITAFAREHDLERKNISAVLHGRINQTKKWKFTYIEEIV